MALAVLTLPLFTTSALGDEGEGVAPAPVEQPVGDPSEEPVPEPVEEPAPDPALEPAPAPEPEPVTQDEPVAPLEEEPVVESPVKTVMRDSARVVQDAVEVLACVNGTVKGGFEIDGNLAECDFTDWDSAGVPGPTNDGFDDGTQFTEGSKEMDNPSTWVNATGTAPGKDDIGNVYLYNTTVSGTIWSFFGFFRDANTGTTAYDVEYNQARNVAGSSPTRPNRSAGDLLIQVTQQGNGDFVITDAFLWTVAEPGDALDKACYTIAGYSPASGWCPMPPANWSAAFVGATSADRFFAEGALNISALFGPGTCIGDFGTMNIRSRASDTPTSALKDWVGPLDVDIQGTCKDLVIEKRDADTDELIGGPPLKFEITPDPRPGADNDPPATVYVVDNEDESDITPAEAAAGQIPDEDNTVGRIKITEIEPGTYTITEKVPPTDYFMAPAPGAGESCPAATEAPVDKNCAVVVVATTDGFAAFQDERIWEEPTITKTAAGSYDASYSWEIRKTVAVDGQSPAADNPATPADESGLASQSVPQGTDAVFDYEVTVVGTETKSGYEVKGEVRVVNPNHTAMTVTLTDKIENGANDIACTFDDDTVAGADYEVSVPKSTAEAPYTAYGYTCTLTPAQAASVDLEDNHAWVEWDLSDYPQTEQQAWAQNPGTDSNTASADFGFTLDQVTGKTVVVTDEYAEFGGPRTVVFGEDLTKLSGNVYTVSWPYSVTFEDSPAGTCTDYDNTAAVSLPTAQQPLDTDTAVATVCVGSDLSVTKNVVTSMTRSYAYSIDKSVADSTLDVNPATGKATANYTVVVTDGAATDSSWVMSGVITVTNPNEQAVTLTDITDVYAGTSCSVTKGANLVIPAENFATQAVEGQRSFNYVCSFQTQPAYNGTNTATITWSKDTYDTPSGSAKKDVAVTQAQWESAQSMTKVNASVNVVDDKTVPGAKNPLGTVSWTAPGTKHTFTYSLELAGSAGRCLTYNNTASIEQTGQSDSASVTVCWPVNPTVDKTAGGTYDRTYLWEIVKEADQTSVTTDGVNGAEVNYTVTATPDGYVDSGWTMNGTITVSNPNDFKSMTVDITDVPNVGPNATCAVTDGLDVVVPAGQVVNNVLVPGTATRDYVCSVPEQPLYEGGTNTAVITWDGGAASSAPEPVVFALAGETNETVTVVDDKTVPGNEVELGQATWNAEGTPVAFTYSLDLEAEANACEEYTNTAEIVETGQFDDATVEACGPEILPEEEVRPRPPVVKGVETVLPSTGGPDTVLMYGGVGLVLLGGALMLSRRSRRSEV